MEFPSIMPKELDYYKGTSNEDFLYTSLVKNPTNLVLFFESASEDETWTANHEEFMKKLLSWLTTQTFKDQVSKTNYERASFAIQKHFIMFKTYLPQNILLKLKDADIPFNSLLLTASSDFFKQILINECRDKESNILSFPNMTENLFDPIKSFICTGDIPDLPTKGQEEIIDLIKRANAWELYTLSVICENTLSKYLTNENVFDMLATAKKERWLYFEQSCIKYINKLEWGFKLSANSKGRLGFEFYNFQERTIEYFELLRPLIEDLICHGNLVDEPQFGLILREFSKLFLLDVSRTSAYSFQFQEMPNQLNSLSLSECPWLTKEHLKNFFRICPSLKELYLRNDVHLNYSFWGELAKCNHLRNLDISNCIQLQDADLGIILRGLSSLRELSLGNCNQIGENGFLDLAKNLRNLIGLDISYCQISDTALIEIASCCKSLTTLSISGCTKLTEKGILALVKHTLSLQVLDITRCNVTIKTIEEIKKNYSQLILKV